MNKTVNKKMAQKGGMMIEALAMLGLIAVVTPTMYKKSAERTLEVEDINTATTMRSVMGAADSYVSSHYGEIVQEMTSGNKTEKTISMGDLSQYLPYGFNADKLYDFNAPQVSVVRNGNNLTSFVLFPAKEGGDDGLGQERTVRIATLVGANGGYVNGTKTAKGIGGIWSLGQSDFEKVFENQNPNVYSIVTASSDAINNTNTEEDTDKFLYRTAGNGIWHNTMRADLYMGGNTNDLDGYDATNPKSQPFSIRSVKSMIVGADFANGAADAASETGNYGLYIANNANPNAYVYGNLEAGVNSDNRPNFKVTDSVIYGADEKVDEVSQYNLGINSTHLRFGYNQDKSLYDNGSNYNVDIDKNGAIKSRSSVRLAMSKDGKWSDIQLGLLQNAAEEAPHGYLIQGKANSSNAEEDKNAGIISLINDQTFIAKGKKRNGTVYNVDYADRIVINQGGIRGVGDGSTPPASLRYTPNNEPIFPVRVGSNLRVNGILGADQLDTQKFRAASMEVGSDNIDDADKWLKVNSEGIHGSHVEGDYTDGTATLLEVHSGRLAIGTGIPEDVSHGKNNEFVDENSNKNLLLIEKDYGVNLVSTQGINVTAARNNTPIVLANPTIKQEVNDKDITISSLEESNESTNVKIQKTNLEVTNSDSDTIFEVRGNNSSNITSDGGNRYDVAVHGRAVFTSDIGSSGTSPDRTYLSVGNTFSTKSVVNVTQATEDQEKLDDHKYDQVLTIDGNNSPWEDVEDSAGYDTDKGGTVYIRKGMVNVMAPKESYFYGDRDNHVTDAEHGMGVIKASRFVANNMKYTGDDGTVDPTKVPEFFNDTEYKKYNGSSDTTGRYDTYMVNPAYTSVMHDIKLTTRGGARLSDILPDFINKGIYITSNTYPDMATDMKMEMDNNGNITVGGLGEASGFKSTDSQINLGAEDSWASPYLGFVPAPQCPPGYNRLITLAPQSFMMSQAGQMQKGSHARGGDAYYTKNQVPEDSAFTAYNQMLDGSGRYVTQGFFKVQGSEDVKLDKAVMTSATQSSSDVKAKTQGLTLNTVDADGNTIQQNPYFLVSYGDTTPPLTIQQSTWLKTNVIPVVRGGNASYIGDKPVGYTAGWGALMGFVYDAVTYDPIVEQLGAAGNTHIKYNEDNTNVYWNIFPVRRNTLEAYATTYCYFNRNNIGSTWDTTNDYSDDKYIDHYNALKDYKQGSEDKHRTEDTDKGIKGNSGYLERLNDPTLKYDEVW